MLIECELDMMCENDTFSFWSFSSKPVTLVILLLKGGVCLLATQKPIETRWKGKFALFQMPVLGWRRGEGGRTSVQRPSSSFDNQWICAFIV